MDEMTEEFREAEGGSYSPFASHNQNNDLPFYGVLIAGAQLHPSRRRDFYRALDRVVADLAAHGPSEDALARAKATQVSVLARARSDNGCWQGGSTAIWTTRAIFPPSAPQSAGARPWTRRR